MVLASSERNVEVAGRGDVSRAAGPTEDCAPAAVAEPAAGGEARRAALAHDRPAVERAGGVVIDLHSTPVAIAVVVGIAPLSAITGYLFAVARSTPDDAHGESAGGETATAGAVGAAARTVRGWRSARGSRSIAASRDARDPG
jgi:hypothetical protein